MHTYSINAPTQNIYVHMPGHMSRADTQTLTCTLLRCDSPTYIYTRALPRPDVRGISKVGSQHRAPYPLELIHFTTLPPPPAPFLTHKSLSPSSPFGSLTVSLFSYCYPPPFSSLLFICHHSLTCWLAANTGGKIKAVWALQLIANKLTGAFTLESRHVFLQKPKLYKLQRETSPLDVSKFYTRNL